MKKAQKAPWIDLKKLRDEHGWSQKEASDRLGFSRNYLAMVENRKQSISKNMMYAVIEVYGVKYEDFYQDS